MTHPKLPYQRVMESPDIPDSVKRKLRKQHETPNPLVLKREIDRKIRRIFESIKQKA